MTHLSFDKIEYSKDNTNAALNEFYQKATKPVDHCRLRTLDEISSEMCKPTTKLCIEPAVTQPESNGKSCVLYRYESPEQIQHKLKTTGYYIFKNMIPKHILDIAKSYIKGNTVNYDRLNKEFIKPHMLDNIGKEIEKNIINIKYRVSNNNNSSDAASFHRDLQNYSKNKTTRVYTILTYIDGGNMELIPGTNSHPRMSLSEALHFWTKRTPNVMEPGDVLMFESTTIHRGIFYKKQKDRRLIQLFDCVYDVDFDYYQNTILQVPCRKQCSSKVSNSLVKLHKNKTLSNCFNKLVYLNTCLGYSKFGYKLFTTDPDIRYLSPETNQNRLIIKSDTFQKDNLYVMNVGGHKDIDENRRNLLLFITLNFNTILLVALVAILITIFALLIRLIVEGGN